jgi:hypothetical protein
MLKVSIKGSDPGTGNTAAEIGGGKRNQGGGVSRHSR